MRFVSKVHLLLLAFFTSACSQPPSCSSSSVQQLLRQIFAKQFETAKNILGASKSNPFDFEDVSFSIGEIITTSSDDRRSTCKANLHTRFKFKDGDEQLNLFRSLFLSDADTPVSYRVEFTDDDRLYVTLQQ